MKLMTFNIHHGKGIDGKTDLRRIAAEIKHAKADIVALQEVDRFQMRSFWRDQIAFLAKELNMYSSYAPSLNFGFAQYGNAFLSRWPIISKTVYYLNGGLERRSILIIKVNPIENSSLTLINTHLGILRREQKWQMPILCDALAKLEGPAVLMGDFNMEMSELPMKLLQATWHKVTLIQHQATMTNGKEIDHFFINRALAQARAWVQETIASDHHAVVTELPLLK
jgi:endonuclease/exonuclease/phosphatase family metal-dependent hydrolase